MSHHTIITVTGLVHRPGDIDLGDPAGTVEVAFSEICERATLDEEATHASVISRNGEYIASVPLEELLAGGRLMIGDDIRLTIVGGRTLCWNVKDVGSVRFTSGPEPDSVPENPPH